MLRSAASRVWCASDCAGRIPMALRFMSQQAPPESSLWDRMGGEPVIRPMVREIYDLHATDPLTAPWFGPSKFNNVGTSDHVVEKVFTFFSAGIGGPHKYTGKSMADTHLGMKISGPAFHAVCYHVISKMEEYKAGGHREREEVLDILYSLKEEVLSRSEEPPPNDGKFIEFDAKE